MPFKFKLRESVRIGEHHGQGQIVARTDFSGRRVPGYLVRYSHPIYGEIVTDWFGEHMLLPIQPPPGCIDKRDEANP